MAGYVLKVIAGVEPLDGGFPSDHEAVDIANAVAAALEGLREPHGWNTSHFEVNVVHDDAGIDVTATDLSAAE